PQTSLLPGHVSGTDVARARVRTLAGRWMVVHGPVLGDRDGGGSRVAVWLEAARPPELAPLIADAYGFTERERGNGALQLVPGLLGVPGELHCLESFERLLEKRPVVAGGAERAEGEWLGERSLLQPLGCFGFDALAVADRRESIQEGRDRLPLPVEFGWGEFRDFAEFAPGQCEADLGRFEPALVPAVAFHADTPRFALQPAGLVLLACKHAGGGAVQQDGDGHDTRRARSQVGVHSPLCLGRPVAHLIPAPGHSRQQDLPARSVQAVVWGEPGCRLGGHRA